MFFTHKKGHNTFIRHITRGKAKIANVAHYSLVATWVFSFSLLCEDNYKGRIGEKDIRESHKCSFEEDTTKCVKKWDGANKMTNDTVNVITNVLIGDGVWTITASWNGKKELLSNWSILKSGSKNHIRRPSIAANSPPHELETQLLDPSLFASLNLSHPKKKKKRKKSLR